MDSTDLCSCGAIRIFILIFLALTLLHQVCIAVKAFCCECCQLLTCWHCCFHLLTYQFCCAICRRGLQLQSVWAPNINIQSVSWAKNSVHQLASEHRICPKLVRQVPPNRHRNVLRAVSVAQVGQSLVHCTRHCDSGSNLSPVRVSMLCHKHKYQV